MFGRETPNCPNCEGKNVRPSKWHSHGEKAHNPGRCPARCSDCGTRFMMPAGKDLRKLAIPLGAGTVVVIVFVGLLVWLTRTPEAKEEPAASVSMTITAAAMKAAEDGDPETQFAVASSMLADAELNLAYSAKAVEFLQRAADRGHKRAMLRLGLLYRKGVGALQNYALAAKWIESAARHGDPQAMLEYGRLYREGLGVPRDPVKAYVWLNRAAAARDPDAVRERGEVTRMLTADELKQAQDQSVAADAALDQTAAATTATAVVR
jgi:TPR repeat protein